MDDHGYLTGPRPWLPFNIGSALQSRRAALECLKLDIYFGCGGTHFFVYCSVSLQILMYEFQKIPEAMAWLFKEGKDRVNGSHCDLTGGAGSEDAA